MNEAQSPPSVIILEVRAGKIQNLGKSGQQSAICKIPQIGKVEITKYGVVGDQQAFWGHGGIDKAVHQYSADHYETWREEKPDKAHLFDFGGFGENLVAKGLNEGNVCIGDQFQIGEEVILEIAEPRMPCATLNRRFEWRRASVRTQKTGRSGWYLRVVKTGFIQQGDQMVLIKRSNPLWSIANCLQLLTSKTPDKQALFQLSQVHALGDYIREVTQSKLAGEPGEDAEDRLRGSSPTYYNYKLIERVSITPRIKQLTFSIQEPDNNTTDLDLGRFPYMELKFGPLECFERSYSVVSGNKNKFILGIAQQSNSRGGSSFLHESLKEGDIIQASKGRGDYVGNRGHEIDKISQRHIFIIGGIGVTAFLLEIKDLETKGADFEIHYAVRSMDEAAYASKLPSCKTTYYSKAQNQRLNLNNIIPKYDPSNKKTPTIYCCGPTSLMDQCQELVDELSYPEQQIHMESFGIGTESSAEPFEVEVEGTGKAFEVRSNKTILDVLNEAGFDVPYSCKAGNCGMCAIDYCKGNIQHRGSALSKQEKLSTMLSCVSRARGTLMVRNDF